MSFGSVWLAIDHFLSQCLVFVIFCGNFFVCICINNYDFDCIDGISLMLIILNVFHIVHQNVVVFLIKMLIFVFPLNIFLASIGLFGNGSFVGWTSYADSHFHITVSLSAIVTFHSIYIYFWIMEQVISSCHVTSCLWDANI